MNSTVTALGFSSCPSAHIEWRVDSHGCYKFDNAALGLIQVSVSVSVSVQLGLAGQGRVREETLKPCA